MFEEKVGKKENPWIKIKVNEKRNYAMGQVMANKTILIISLDNY